MIKYGYDFYIVAGFLTGSILFGRLIPMLLYGKDVEKESEDGNPGTFKCFLYVEACSAGLLFSWRIIGKGLLPVAACARRLGMDSWKFALVMAAPVFGHAHSIFRKGHGGKSNRGFIRRADRTVSGKPSAAASDRLLSSFCGCDPCKIKYKKKRICFFCCLQSFLYSQYPTEQFCWDVS